MAIDSKNTLLLIDGHSLAFRAFYALPVDSFQTRDGQHTNAIHGFLSMLLTILKNENPSHLAIAFDVSRYSFRTREYPEYKGTRGETPAEFIGQVPLLQEALTAMNIHWLQKEDYEADDILATLATQGEAEGFSVLVVSGDRDTIQLVTDKTTLLYPSSQGVSALTRYTVAKVQERYGIRPEQYPDVAALVGETSDNLIGISKVGEKTAVKWLLQYGSLDGILEHAEEIPGVVGQNLRDQRENAIRNRRLNHLVRDVDLPVSVAQLERQQINVDAVRDVFTRLQFRSLQQRVLELAGVAGTEPSPAPQARSTPGSSASDAERSSRRDVGAPVDAPYVLPEPAEPPTPQLLLDEELAGWLQRVATLSEYGIAVSIQAGESGIFEIGLASANESVSLPWVAGSKDYLPLETWLASSEPKVMFDAKRQLKIAAHNGLAIHGSIRDSMIAAQLRGESNATKSLAALVDAILGETMPAADANALIQDESSQASAATDAWFALRVLSPVLGSLEVKELSVFDEIETPVLPVLTQMELTGIAVDQQALDGLSHELGERVSTFEQAAFAAIGREVNLASPKQLQEILFNQLNMPKTRATKTGYSTDATALAELQESNPHPFLDALLSHRDVTKLRQIVDTLRASVAPDARIHTTYGQIGAATGRLSSNDPNLQNIPIRTEDGRRIRAAFVASDGCEGLLTADYSQIEMRIMAHLSEDPGLIDAFNAGEDLHRYVGAKIFDVEPADVTPLQRTKVKAMSYGLVYGLSAFGLAKQLGISNSEAKQLMNDYFARFGAVRDYLHGVVAKASDDGYTTTIDGRRRRFPDLQSSNRIAREAAQRAALNAPIQGTAADLMKSAMVNLNREMAAAGVKSRMLLQVHDELVFELAPGEREQMETMVRTNMASVANLLVPLEVQVGFGRNWDEAGH